MPLTTGFTIKLPIEDLTLNSKKNIKLSANIAKYLTIFQLNGVRFLYQKYEENNNENACILNDESGLGKTIQTIAFLNVLLSMNQQQQQQRKKYQFYLIICKNIGRIHYWQYHIELFIQQLSESASVSLINVNILNESSSIPKSSSNNSSINLTTWKFMNENIPIFSKTLINYLIIDERDVITTTTADDDDLDIAVKGVVINKLKRLKYKLILSSKDITVDLNNFYNILKCYKFQNFITKLSHEEFKERFIIDSHLNSSNDKKLIMISKQNQLLMLTQNIRLRRSRREFLNELPLIEPEIFHKCFDEWTKEKFGNNLINYNTLFNQNLTNTSNNNNNITIDNEMNANLPNSDPVNDNFDMNKSKHLQKNSKTNNNNNNSSGDGSYELEKLRFEIKNKKQEQKAMMEQESVDINFSPLLFDDTDDNDEENLLIQNSIQFNDNPNINYDNLNSITQNNIDRNNKLFEIISNTYKISKKLQYKPTTIRDATKLLTIKNPMPIDPTTALKPKQFGKKRSFSEPISMHSNNNSNEFDININNIEEINSEYFLKYEKQYLTNNKKRKLNKNDKQQIINGKCITTINNNASEINQFEEMFITNDLMEITSLGNKYGTINETNLNTDDEKNTNTDELIPNSQPITFNAQNLLNNLTAESMTTKKSLSIDNALETSIKYNFNLDIDINNLTMQNNNRRMRSNDIEIISQHPNERNDNNPNTIWISSTSIPNNTTGDQHHPSSLKSNKRKSSINSLLNSPELFDDLSSLEECNNHNIKQQKSNQSHILTEFITASDDDYNQLLNGNNRSDSHHHNVFEITSNNIFSNKLQVISGKIGKKKKIIEKSTTFDGLEIFKRK